MGHLDLSSQVGAVDDVAGMLLAGDKRHRTAQGQVHPNTNLPIIQKSHARTWKLRLAGSSGEGAKTDASNPETKPEIVSAGGCGAIHTLAVQAPRRRCQAHNLYPS